MNKKWFSNKIKKYILNRKFKFKIKIFICNLIINKSSFYLKIIKFKLFVK